MKKHQKVATGIILSTMASVAMLSGCGGSQTEEAAKTASGTEAKAQTGESVTEGEAEGAKDPVTLRFVSWQSNHAEGNQAVADAYHKLNPNVTVEFEYIGDMNSADYMTKTDVMIMGGEPIDIVMADSLMAYTVRAASNAYLPLDSFFEAEGTTAEDMFNIVVRVDEQVYGIPAEMKYNNLVLINKDMLDEAGLLVPDLNWTWDDYREYAIKMTKGEGADKIYGSFFRSGANIFGINSAKKGNPYFNDDGTLTFDEPYFSQFLQWRFDLEGKDGASVPQADIKALNLNYRDQFFNGKVAMLPLGTYVLSDIGNEKYKHDFTTTFARMPLWNAEDEHYNAAEATVFSIARTSEHPQEAFDFLKFWSTEGVKIKGMFLSNEKDTDRMESINNIVGDFTDLVDMEALNKVMTDEKWIDSYSESTPTYQNEISNLEKEETDKFLLGAQSLEDTVANLMERGNEIIEANK